jgi:hypothetical protein
MALPNHTPLNYRIWHYTYLTFCGLVFFLFDSTFICNLATFI